MDKPLHFVTVMNHGGRIPWFTPEEWTWNESQKDYERKNVGFGSTRRKMAKYEGQEIAAAKGIRFVSRVENGGIFQ